MIWILLIVVGVTALQIFFGGCFISGFVLYLKDKVKDFYRYKIKKEVKPYDYFNGGKG